jgi:nitrogenase molybdenum-iron protein alpha/beta subunit
MAEYGVPLLASRSPYGFSGTQDWLEGICEGLGLERSREINALKESCRQQFEENKKLLKGKKVFIGGGPGRLVGLLQLLSDYEMDIKVAALFWPHKHSQEDLNYVFEQRNLKIERIVVSPSLYELEEFAESYDFDVWAGGYQEQHTCRRHKIPFVPITVYTVPHVGFRGAVNFGDKMIMAMQGFCFTENVFNAKELPECTHHSK